MHPVVCLVKVDMLVNFIDVIAVVAQEVEQQKRGMCDMLQVVRAT